MSLNLAPVLLGIARSTPAKSMGSDQLVLSLIQLAVLLAAVVLTWNAIASPFRGKRPGKATSDALTGSARYLMQAVAVMAVASLVSLIPFGGAQTVVVGLRLAVGPLLLLAVLRLPKSSLSGSYRTRVLLDGLMITTGAAAFAWYFLLGPAVVKQWVNVPDAVIGLGYPCLDVLLVAVLLAVSAKSRRLQRRVWAPLAVGTSLLVLSDCMRELALQSPNNLAIQLASPCRVAATILLAVTAIQLASRDEESILQALPRQPEKSDETILEPDVSDGLRIWNSLLPYALVPATAALAVYSWQRNLPSGITLGLVAATTVLVALTFSRQFLAIKENHRLFEQAAASYAQSHAYAESMELLYQELSDAKLRLQENNGELAKANQQLHDQATRDPLTRLPNHRAMTTALDQELDRASRYGRSCSLLFMDLDHFKALNDSCGHLCGDAVLREIVGPLQSSLRAQDSAGRWGGEEFVVLLPETDLADAIAAADRVRESVAEHRFTSIGGGQLTCSIGVASFPFDASNRDGLIEAADKAMYAAKRLGKNQVRSAADPSVVAFLTDVRRGSSREEIATWGIVEALTTLVRAHDPQEDVASVQIADLAMRVAATMRMTAAEIRTIGLAARLHDVGMVSVPQGRLDTYNDGLDLLAVHPVVGADIVGRIPSLVMLAPLIRGHHERWDGTGYPDRISGEDIPIGARIIAACDAYYWSTTGPAGLPAEIVLRRLETESGTVFDARVVASLRATVQVLMRPSAQAG